VANVGEFDRELNDQPEPAFPEEKRLKNAFTKILTSRETAYVGVGVLDVGVLLLALPRSFWTSKKKNRPTESR
jgi:hypothetical protein